MACALFFSEECAVSEKLKIKLNIAYKRLLDESCESKTGFSLSLKRNIWGPWAKLLTCYFRLQVGTSGYKLATDRKTTTTK